MNLFRMLSVALCLNAHAQGSSGSGGGDLAGLAAASSLQSALLKIKEVNPPLLSESELKMAQEKADKILVFVVDEPLPVTTSGITQVGTGYSVSGAAVSITKLNRLQWTPLKTAVDQEAFMLHEILVMINVEGTGDYHLSGKYALATSAIKHKQMDPTVLKDITEIISRFSSYSPSELKPDFLIEAVLTDPTSISEKLNAKFPKCSSKTYNKLMRNRYYGSLRDGFYESHVKSIKDVVDYVQANCI